MLQVMFSAEGEQGNQGAAASMKETVKKGGIEDSPNLGKKRSASEDPEGMTSKQGKKSLSEDPTRRLPRPHCALKGISFPPSRK